jgi:hypothetical protein
MNGRRFLKDLPFLARIDDRSIGPEDFALEPAGGSEPQCETIIILKAMSTNHKAGIRKLEKKIAMLNDALSDLGTIENSSNCCALFTVLDGPWWQNCNSSWPLSKPCVRTPLC